jgi:polysaccharide export outer membrane protein
MAGASAQQPPAATAPPPSGYVLGPDDQIVIRALEGLDLGDKPVLIGTNGNITLPLIGRVQAAGLTVEQLEAELASRLKTYVQEPQISVTVTEFRSQPVSVFGAVTTPGVVQLRGRKTLYEVLSMAGGPRETAGSTVSIVRLLENGPIPLPGAGPDPTGRFSTAELDMQQILDGRNPAANIEIKPHDVISVSQSNGRTVYVVGDVQRSGAFNLGGQRTISVLSALSMAGGLGRTAKPEQAKIFRPAADPQKHEEIAVNIKQILAGKAEDIALRPDDVLVVPTSSRKTFVVLLSGTLGAAVSSAIYAGAVH